MALPQQGTETCFAVQNGKAVSACVNGLTPTGDGNFLLGLKEI